ncbi:glycoside hydrolase family 5 protein [Xylariaceae sp. FL0594]|nr:glycoside hydrolase family 5 protein [Xylariaceae sp. FL0594]
MADTVSWSTRRPTSKGGVLERSAQWPNGPLVTSGRWITDATGAKITYAGVNWPGSLETMIPEGLQYQSVETIVSKVKGLGMNAIRLTYATEMIDKYYDNGKTDVSIRDAFIAALGQAEGMAVYDKVVAKNPSFGPNTTRLQVYDAIAAECAKHEIYLHLDNHVSKSGWCCTPLDGNSWWGDTFFDTDKWTRGLSFMAEHGKAWPSLVSMSLRNELRPPLTSAEASGTYNWETWYRYMRQGADAVHSANPDVLIFLSGLDTDSNLTAVVQGSALEPGTAEFSRDDFKGYGHSKLVLELHAYDNIITTPTVDCSVSTGKLFDAGFQTFSKDAANRFPLVVTEFGTPQDTGAATNSYISCILDYFSSERAGWMIWSLGGSYYIREGSRDVDESWGILSHDWSSLRSPDFVNQKLKPAIEASQAPLTEDDDYEESGASNDSDDSQTGDTADEGNAAASSLTKSPFVTVVSVVVAVALISHLL